MQLRKHEVPSSEDMISHIATAPAIIDLTHAYRGALNKHYSQDVEAIRKQIETLQRPTKEDV